MRLTASGPGLQGPIDDAFTTPFLCVRGTGKAWNPAVQAWADASLKRFAYEWNRYFRGDLPVKDDTAVTDGGRAPLQPDPLRRPRQQPLDRARCCRSCRSAGRATNCESASERYAAADHAPVLIQPNPLAEGRYVVLNSGHTFHEKELASLNYLLFPRLGDWAVLKVGGKVPDDPSEPLDEERRAGRLLRRGVAIRRKRRRRGRRSAWRRSSSRRRSSPDDFGDYKSPLKFDDGSPVKSAGRLAEAAAGNPQNLARLHGPVAGR